MLNAHSTRYFVDIDCVSKPMGACVQASMTPGLFALNLVFRCLSIVYVPSSYCGFVCFIVFLLIVRFGFTPENAQCEIKKLNIQSHVAAEHLVVGDSSSASAVGAAASGSKATDTRKRANVTTDAAAAAASPLYPISKKKKKDLVGL